MGLRAIVVRCPNCNANLEIASTVTSVTCSYCGTISRIQGRTAVFQTPPMPPSPPAPPVARQQVPVLAVLGPLLIFGVVAGGIAFSTRAAPGLVHGKPSWAGEVPLLIDVDGDGTGDPVGLVYYAIDDTPAHLAAYSGKTGAQLWESESLGKYAELGSMEFAALGSLVLIASNDGTLIARDARAKGALRWQLAMGEKIAAMCARSAGEIVIGTADDRWFAVEANGSKRETKKLFRFDRDYTNDAARAIFERVGAEASDVCVPFILGYHHPPNLIALQPWHDLANIPGMYIELGVRHPGGPTLAIGRKSLGSPVPMLARLALPLPPPAPDPEQRPSSSGTTEGKPDLPGATWVTEIPSIDPLNGRFDPAHLAMTDKAAIALYEGAHSSYRLAAFDLETGKRLWDRPIATGNGITMNTSLVVTGDVVLLAMSQHLTAFALADGVERFVIGPSR